MLEIKFVRQNLKQIEKSLENRGETADLESFKHCDTKRKSLLLEIEDLRHRRNIVSEQIALMKRNKEDTDDLVAKMRQVADRIKALDHHLSENEDKINHILFRIPNLPHHSVPIGKDSSENPVINKVGTVPDFDFEPQAHWTLGENLKIFDFEAASKITGARFPLYLGAGARLERALINFMLDIHTTEHGYKEILPPFIVNRDSMTGTGQLPKFEEDLFKLQGWDYFLVPTAEVPVTNIHKGEVLDEEVLPILYTAYTPCFRSEAGSYGKDTRGLIRQHQFNKVELVKFSNPDSSYEEHESLTKDAARVLELLGLP